MELAVKVEWKPIARQPGRFAWWTSHVTNSITGHGHDVTLQLHEQHERSGTWSN
jgi:hypothetical protein